MNVLQVIDSGGLYGAERMMISLIRALSELGVSARLASIGTPGSAEKALEKEARRVGIETVSIAMAAGPDRYAAKKLLRQAAADKFDVIHTHGYKANALIAGAPRRHRKTPVIATLHGWTSGSRFSRLGMYEMAERWLLRRADKVVAVSQTMVDRWRLDRRYGKKLTIIENGIEELEPDSSNSAALDESIKRAIADRASIVAAGRLSWEKGFDVLLDAVAELRDREISVTVVLFGEGGQRDALHAQIRDLGLSDSVLMPGFINDTRGILSEFDVAAIPSRSEGLPLVLLEALFAGVPVAATSVGEMPAVIDYCGAGRCARPADAQSLADLLAEHIAKRIDDAALRAIQKRAEKRYSASSMAKQYVSAYRSLQSAS